MSSVVDKFVRSILKSGLLAREQIRSALETLPEPQRDDPKLVAAHFIQNRLLTPYQSNKLLQGVSLGLCLGSYHIEAPIGRGGMGTVYLGRDTRSEKPVAIKVLSSKRAREGERHLQRFQREMALSQKLRHGNVAETLDVGVHQGVHYIVLEYIPGQTLQKLVQTEGALKVPRAARLFAEVAAALEHAHEQGLIHRDIKPSNLMVTPDDHVKLLDLGLALMIGEVVDDAEVVGGKGYIVGSVEYIAPEQTRDPTQIDPRADLYAMGCCLYFALTGKPPVQGTNSKERIQAHRHQEPDPIQSRNPEVPDAFARYVHSLLAKKPDKRPRTATEVKQEMLAWADASAPPIVDLQASANQQAKIIGQQNHFFVDDTLGEAFPASPPSEDSGPAEEGDPREQKWLWWGVIGVSAFVSVVMVIVIIAILAGK